MWRQKLRELWLKQRGRNTKFFHNCTIVGRRSMNISTIRDDSWIRLMERDHIRKHLMDKLKSEFISSKPPSPALDGLVYRVISEDDNVLLNQVPDREEVINEVKNLASLKAPSPYGLPACCLLSGIRLLLLSKMFSRMDPSSEVKFHVRGVYSQGRQNINFFLVCVQSAFVIRCTRFFRS